MPASETETQEGNEQSLQDEIEETVRLRSTFPQRRPTSAICTRRTPAGSAPSDANGVDILRRQWGLLLSIDEPWELGSPRRLGVALG